MIDLEKVITGLEHCITDEPCCRQKYITCPYTPRRTGDDNCARALAKDVLALLKEQQPKTGHWIEQEDCVLDTYYDCSVCGESWSLIEGTPLENRMNYCPHCGAKMEGR